MGYILILESTWFDHHKPHTLFENDKKQLRRGECQIPEVNTRTRPCFASPCDAGLVRITSSNTLRDSNTRKCYLCTWIFCYPCPDRTNRENGQTSRGRM